MFSVNIDKIIEMNQEEHNSYQELCNHVLAKGKKYKTVAVLGENGIAFKMASKIMNAGNKVLFIDADFSTLVFLGKYKLGKNLKGICDYLNGNELPDKLICLTNKDNMQVVFSGDVETYALLGPNYTAFNKLMNLYKQKYDYIILEAGDNRDIASRCDGTILIMDAVDYSEKKAKKEVEKLSNQNCLVLGVILNDIK